MNSASPAQASPPATEASRAPVLELRGLDVDIGRGSGALRVVQGVSLQVLPGEAVGLVGESGCGKSMTAFSVMQLFPSPEARIAGGDVLLEGRSLMGLARDELRLLRGSRMGMVFQDPSSFLDPLMPVGRQIAQTLHAHGQAQGSEARVLELLDLMELPEPRDVARKYPHELSGGMRQRVLIAAALAMRPALLIADEPTTALDVTVQAGILRLLMRLRSQLNLAILLITHDLAVVAQTCQRVYVMYGGEIVEHRPVEALFDAPAHPYAQGLLGSVLNPLSRANALFSIPGTVPIAGHWPSGCRFHPRCPIALPGRCDQTVPALTPHAGGAVRCLRAHEPIAAAAWRQP